MGAYSYPNTLELTKKILLTDIKFISLIFIMFPLGADDTMLPRFAAKQLWHSISSCHSLLLFALIIVLGSKWA